MRFEFESDYDRRVYAEWTRTLLLEVFGQRLQLHDDLYELSHVHRTAHGESNCEVWPSPLALAPLWSFLAESRNARRFLETGCGVGYTAALMADAGGPGIKVDTIEIDLSHADIAESKLSEKGLTGRVRVLRGDAAEILPGLPGPYDIALADGGGDALLPQIARLMRPGGLLIAGDAKRMVFDQLETSLTQLRERASAVGVSDDRTIAEAEQAYREAAALAVRRATVVDGAG